jgi:hypothetical protein
MVSYLTLATALNFVRQGWRQNRSASLFGQYWGKNHFTDIYLKSTTDFGGVSRGAAVDVDDVVYLPAPPSLEQRDRPRGAEHRTHHKTKRALIEHAFSKNKPRAKCRGLP